MGAAGEFWDHLLRWEHLKEISRAMRSQELLIASAGLNDQFLENLVRLGERFDALTAEMPTEVVEFIHQRYRKH